MTCTVPQCPWTFGRLFGEVFFEMIELSSIPEYTSRNLNLREKHCFTTDFAKCTIRLFLRYTNWNILKQCLRVEKVSLSDLVNLSELVYVKITLVMLLSRRLSWTGRQKTDDDLEGARGTPSQKVSPSMTLWGPFLRVSMLKWSSFLWPSKRNCCNKTRFKTIETIKVWVKVKNFKNQHYLIFLTYWVMC